jgi:sugar lactone lactonase YvrE
MFRTKADLLIRNRGGSGEGPSWDARRRRLSLTDNHARQVRTYHLQADGSWAPGASWTPDRPTGTAIPRRDGGFVVLAGLEVYLLSETGETEDFLTIDADPALVFLNDAKCDRLGRIWVGTAATDFTTPRGELYRIEPDGSVSSLLTGVAVSNGLDWSPDEKTFYYVDSGPLTISAFDCDLQAGTIANRRALVTLPRGQTPDGMCVDAEGCLWVAIFGGSQVHRYAPDGTLTGVVELPVTGVTSCGFGGERGDELFITTLGGEIPPDAAANCGLTPEEAAAMIAPEEAGSLFVVRTPVRGGPTHAFPA